MLLRKGRQTIRRTEITIETSRRLVIRQFHGLLRGWCEGCLAEVRMITPYEAAALASVSSRTIYRWVEDAKVHFTEHLGVLLVCVESLPANNNTVAAESDHAILQ